MRVFKNMLIIIYNVLSFLILLLIKPIVGIVMCLFRFIHFLGSLATGIIFGISWFMAAIFLFVGIVALFTDGFNKTNVAFIFSEIIFITFFVVLPYIIGFLVELLDLIGDGMEFLLFLPPHAFVISLSDISSENCKRERVREKFNNWKEQKNEKTYEMPFEEKTSGASAWFAGIQTADELKKRYRDLLKIYHPDNQAGDTGAAQQIQEEYDKLLKEFQ